VVSRPVSLSLALTPAPRMVPVTDNDGSSAVWPAQGLGTPESGVVAPLSGATAPLSVSDSSPVAPPRMLESLDRAPQALVKAATRDNPHATRRLASPRTPKQRVALGLSFAPPTAMNGTYYAVRGLGRQLENGCESPVCAYTGFRVYELRGCPFGQGQKVRQVKAWSPVRQQVPTLRSTSLAQLSSSRARPRHLLATQLLDVQSRVRT